MERNHNHRPTPIFFMFQDILELVVEKYGPKYYFDPQFASSPERRYMEELVELVKEESRLRIPLFNPNLN